MSKASDREVLRSSIAESFGPVVCDIATSLGHLERVAKHGTGDQSPHGQRGKGNPGGTTPADRGSQAARADDKARASGKKNPIEATRARRAESLARSTAQAQATYKEAQSAVQADLKELGKIIGKPMPGGRLDWGHVGSMQEARRQVAELLSFLRGDEA
jgi:hypothetical protein